MDNVQNVDSYIHKPIKIESAWQVSFLSFYEILQYNS
jgi:hypothetical protein